MYPGGKKGGVVPLPTEEDIVGVCSDVQFGSHIPDCDAYVQNGHIKYSMCIN
jgi:hypothetical protein